MEFGFSSCCIQIPRVFLFVCFWVEAEMEGWVAVDFFRCQHYINLYTDIRVILRRKSQLRSFWTLLIAIIQRQANHFPNLWIESHYLEFCGFSFCFKALFICSVWALPWLNCYKTQNRAQGISVPELASETTSLPLHIWTGTKSFITLWICEAGLQNVRDPGIGKPLMPNHCWKLLCLFPPPPPCLQWSELCV